MYYCFCETQCVSCGLSPISCNYVKKINPGRIASTRNSTRNSDSRLNRHPRSSAHTELFNRCIRKCLNWRYLLQPKPPLHKGRCLRMVRGPCIFKSYAFMRQITFTVTCSPGHSSAVWSKGVLRECETSHMRCILLLSTRETAHPCTIQVLLVHREFLQ